MVSSVQPRGREVGPGVCKITHLGKNSLKNRRFLESSNADSGQSVWGCQAAGQGLVQTQQRCRGRERTDWPLPFGVCL